MAIGVEEVEFTPVYGEVYHVGHWGDVRVEEEAGARGEFVVVAVVDPDGVGLRVEDIEDVVIEGEGAGAAPVAVGGEEGDGDRGIRFVEAVNQDAIGVHAKHLRVEGIDGGEDGDVYEGADDEAFVREGAAAEGLIGLVAAPALPDADDIANVAVEQVEIVGGGGQTADDDVIGKGGGEDGDVVQADDGIQLVENGLGFLAEGGGFFGSLVSFGQIEVGDDGVPGGAEVFGGGFAFGVGFGGLGVLEVVAVLEGAAALLVDKQGNEGEENGDSDGDEDHRGGGDGEEVTAGEEAGEKGPEGVTQLAEGFTTGAGDGEEGGAEGGMEIGDWRFVGLPVCVFTGLRACSFVICYLLIVNCYLGS